MRICTSRGMLAELIQFTEFRRACLGASEADAVPGPSGTVMPAAMPLFQTLGAGGLVAIPSYAEFGGPAAEAVRTYYETANADAPYGVKLFRLAFDAAVSSFSGRQQLYERYYSGDPVRLASARYTLYDKDPHTSRIARLLEDLESCGRKGRG